MGRFVFDLFLFPIQRILWTLFIIQLRSHGCLSLNGEGMALLKFRLRVEVDPYRALANWDRSNPDPCNWAGIFCIDGKVETLNLTGLSLKGNVDPAIGKLSHLKSLLLPKNNFHGAIPKEIGQLSMLQFLDLRENNFSGSVPTEIKETLSMKGLLLCDNWLQGCVSSWNGGSTMFYDWKSEQNTSYFFISSANRKVGSRSNSKAGISEGQEVKKLGDDLGTTTADYFKNKEGPARRELFQENTNLPAAPISDFLPIGDIVIFPSTGSGSFPSGRSKPSTVVAESPKTLQPDSISLPINPTNGMSFSTHGPSGKSRKIGSWVSIILSIVVLAMVFASLFVVCRKKNAATIVPWKTGLSGHLRKAFITGVTKLNRAELEVACEDFSNIVMTFSEFTVFKGTLSSGVEIAVVSTVIKSAKDWSKHSEILFRKKIDTLSRINHKNFINLLGYCEEEEPFMRMMVLEYASSGRLHDHLHVKDFEHLDWNARMRIIMGIAYCLQYMHHDLHPPVAHPDLRSTTVLLTDDYAAKVGDTYVWKEITLKRKISKDESVHSSSGDSHVADHLRSNVYSFGLLVLEIISGKDPKIEDQEYLLQMVSDYLKNTSNTNSMVDPTLKDYKSSELQDICEAIQLATNRDPKRRPTMKEVTGKLRDALAISPEAAAPRLSPLWWAELEILSMEAS